MLRMNILSAVFMLSLSANAIDMDSLKQVELEYNKVQKLIKDGNDYKEVREYLKSLGDKRTALRKKQERKKRKRVPPVIQRRKKQLSTIYKLDEKLSVNEKYEKVIRDLRSERRTLEGLQESYENGASYLKKVIEKAREKIAIIEEERSKLETLRYIISPKDKLDLKTGMMLDAYYLYNGNGPSGGAQTNFRNYDKSHNDFTVNLVEFNFTGTFKDYGFYVDLDFGEFAQQNSSDSVDGNIGQAYLTFEENGYLLKFGKMYTNVGYEVAKAQENWNYSRSFVFSNAGPFWHEGLSLTKGYDNGFGWGLYLYDSWDARREANNEKTYSAQLNYSSDAFSIIYNFIQGAEGVPAGNKTTAHELNTQYNFNNHLSVAFNAVFRQDEEAGANLENRYRQGFVGYLHAVSKRWSFTPRIEFYQDKNTTENAEDGTSLTDGDLEIWAYTLTTSYDFRDNTELRLELRKDSANQNFYSKDSSLTKDQDTVSLAWLMSY